MKTKTEVYYVRDTQDDSNSYWIDEQGNIVTKRELLIEKWNQIEDKAHKLTLRKRVSMG
jgi:hypothetical protein